MSRDLKFRAWHKGYGLNDKPKMLYENYPGQCFSWLNEGQPLEIMQFTGLYDKNNKPIWEWDILQATIKNYKEGLPVNEKYSFIIKNEMVSGCGCCFGVYGWYTAGFDKNSIREDCEIIGNIFENPELMPEAESEK